MALAHPRPREPDAVRLGDQAQLLDTIAAGQPFVTTAVGAEGAPARAHCARRSSPRSRRGSPSSCTRSTRTSSSGDGRSADSLDIARTKFDRDTFRRTLAEAMSHLGVLPPEGVRRDAVRARSGAWLSRASPRPSTASTTTRPSGRTRTGSACAPRNAPRPLGLPGDPARGAAGSHHRDRHRSRRQRACYLASVWTCSGEARSSRSTSSRRGRPEHPGSRT